MYVIMDITVVMNVLNLKSIVACRTYLSLHIKNNSESASVSASNFKDILYIYNLLLLDKYKIRCSIGVYVF